MRLVEPEGKEKQVFGSLQRDPEGLLRTLAPSKFRMKPESIHGFL